MARSSWFLLVGGLLLSGAGWAKAADAEVRDSSFRWMASPRANIT